MEEIQVKNDLGRLNSALIKYQAEKHTVPWSLNELLPDYISEIPSDPWGGRYSITNYLVATGGTNTTAVAVVISSSYTEIPNLHQITNPTCNTTLNNRKLKEAAGSFGLEHPVYVSETGWMIYGSNGKYEQVTVTLRDFKDRFCTFTTDTNGIHITTASEGNILVKRLPPLDALSLLLRDCIRNQTHNETGPMKCSREDYPVVKKAVSRL